jgi:hypothetical protein
LRRLKNKPTCSGRCSFGGTRLELRTLRVLRPRRAIKGGQDEVLELVLEGVDALHEGLVVRPRGWGREHGRALRLAAVAVDAELERRVKIAAVDARATAGRALDGVNLLLELFPRGLLRGKERDATGGPAVAAPFGALVLRLLDLLLRRELAALGRTDGRRVLLRKLVGIDVVDLVAEELARRGLRWGRRGFGGRLVDENVDIGVLHADMEEALLDEHDGCEHEERADHEGSQNRARHECHDDGHNHQSAHPNANRSGRGNVHLLLNLHTNYVRA